MLPTTRSNPLLPNSYTPSDCSHHDVLQYSHQFSRGKSMTETHMDPRATMPMTPSISVVVDLARVSYHVGSRLEVSSPSQPAPHAAPCS